jgi:hypothetical protein
MKFIVTSFLLELFLVVKSSDSNKKVSIKYIYFKTSQGNGIINIATLEKCLQQKKKPKTTRRLVKIKTLLKVIT